MVTGRRPVRRQRDPVPGGDRTPSFELTVGNVVGRF